ncbi:MAG TPA: hypothetical protein VF655_11210, partial [Allosphingosinicella sp.]
MSMKPLILIAAALGAAAPAAAERPNEARDMLRQFGFAPPAQDVAKAIAVAEKHPLGSLKNPVRENMPEGQRAYLSRLRCPEGQA